MAIAVIIYWGMCNEYKKNLAALLIIYLREYLMNTDTISSFRTKDADFTRTRKLPFWRVATLILRSWKASLQNRINKFFNDLDLLENIPTASAFCQAREKIKPEFFKALNENVVKFFYDNYEKQGFVKRWKGHLLWAVDGSYINIPDTVETRGKYGIQTHIFNDEGVVQALASFLYDVLNEININSGIAETKIEKSFIFDGHSKQYRKDAIIIYDRLYSDYSVQKKFAKENGLPDEVTVRLVKVELENGEIEVLMTSLLNEEKYKLEDFKWLYSRRWGVETYLDRLKNQLEVERFSSEKLTGIEQGETTQVRL